MSAQDAAAMDTGEGGVIDEEDDEGDYDSSAYLLFHQASLKHPCLSFDFILDQLGDNRTTLPHTAYMVAGSQARRTRDNTLSLVKMSNLIKEPQGGSRDDESGDNSSEGDYASEDDEVDIGKKQRKLEKSAQMNLVNIKYSDGCINRVRCCHAIRDHTLVAVWSEIGRVNVFDVTELLSKLDSSATAVNGTNVGPDCGPIKWTPLFTTSTHRSEGFALDWSPCTAGLFASGDCKGGFHIWSPTESGSWIHTAEMKGTKGRSVEDIQWSPTEASVLASASVDGSIKVWDVRSPQGCMISVPKAHAADVNVISWNRGEPFLASGSDDKSLKIWDLRQIQTPSPTPSAQFNFHTGPLTSVEWHSSESSILCSASEDHKVALWDLSVERDSEAEGADQEDASLPPQLLFVHEGQREVKEVHFHPQIPGLVLSTANTGFNIFKTVNV